MATCKDANQTNCQINITESIRQSPESTWKRTLVPQSTCRNIFGFSTAGTDNVLWL